MNHKNLDAWKVSIEFVNKIYDLTDTFPKREQYSLTDQIRRSAVSIPSNIAEGAARETKKEFIRFLYISLGSASELETQLIIAFNRKYFSESEQYFEEIGRIKQMLIGLIKFLRKS